MQALLTRSLRLPTLPNPNPNPIPRPNHLSFRSRPCRPQTLSASRRRHVPTAAAAAEAASAGGFLAASGGLAAALAGGAAVRVDVSRYVALLRAPVGAAMAAAVRWLGVYREVLLVGVLLSWFPNIPWDRQPFSALRDLCDPFLALCREIMPPVFGRKLDLSPLVAFMAIDIIIMILRPQPRI